MFRTSCPSVWYIAPHVEYASLFRRGIVPSGTAMAGAAVAFLTPQELRYRLPEDGRPEIAFYGRSNVGKSSLVNALVQQQIMVTSKKPGRTQTINFMHCETEENRAGRLWRLVDLPGYGYAKATRETTKQWHDTIERYFKFRADAGQELRRVMLLVDARRGLGSVDWDVVRMMEKARIEYQFVITKSDKLRKASRDAPLGRGAGALGDLAGLLGSGKYRHAFPAVVATSARTGEGLLELRQILEAEVCPPKR